MTARAHLLDALRQLYAGMAAVRIQAEEEGDHWAGLAASWIEQAVSDAAARAEIERRQRGET